MEINCEAIGAVGEIMGAMAVVITLIYLAVQVRHAKAASADQSRIYRATRIAEVMLETCRNDALRMSQTRDWGMEPYDENLAREIGTTVEEATRLDWGNGYYFWMWWGQYASTTESKDNEELKHIVKSLGGSPGMRNHWKHSPISRPLLEDEFVTFVDEILEE